MIRFPIIVGVLLVVLAIAWSTYRVLEPVTQKLSVNYNHLFGPTEADGEYEEILRRNQIDVRGGDLRVQQLADWTNLAVDSEALDELDYVWDSPPGSGRYWLPSARAIDDAYGLMMATLLTDLAEEEMRASDHSTLERKLSEWKAAITRSEAGRPAAASTESSRAIAAIIRALPLDAAANSKLSEIQQDYLNYDNRYENGGRVYSLAPDFGTWKRAPAARLRIIASGSVRIVDKNGLLLGQPFAAVLWGREQTFFSLQRPTWFKRQYIAEARRRSVHSNRYAAFFGPDGLLERIPVGIICVKQPIYMIEVRSAALPAVEIGQSLQFISHDREFQLAYDKRVQLGGGRFWKVVLPNKGPQLTAVVSERMR